MKTNQLQQLLDYANETNGTYWTPDEIRNYSADADIIEYYTGTAFDDRVVRNLLIELLENLTDSELMSIFRDCNSYDGSFDFADYYENDEDFFNLFFENKPDEAVRAVCYGDYRYSDDFVRFNAYGNLESFNGYDVKEAAREYIAELADYILRERRTTWNSEIDDFIALLEEVESEDEE